MTSHARALLQSQPFEMLSSIKLSKQPTNETNAKPTRLCITLRQWAIILSVVIFIISAVITTCTVLGNLHTKQLQEMLEEDIEEEHYKHYKHQLEYYDRSGLSLNEARLHRSQDAVLVYSKVLSICMWLSWLNLVFAAILIYGVATKTSHYMVPWIFTSGVTYLLAITSVLMAYMGLIPGIEIGFTLLVLALTLSLVFINVWYTLMLYYLSLVRGRCHGNGFKVVQSVGGYTHTVKPLGGATDTPMV